MDYKIGDKVVYPNHGVGIVEQISYGILNGRTERYFMIRIVSSGLRVMVPQSNAETVGLRSVIRSIESTKVLGFLEKGKLNSHHDWKHRFKENSERMRTGSLLEVAVVLKSLVSLSRSGCAEAISGAVMRRNVASESRKLLSTASVRFFAA